MRYFMLLLILLISMQNLGQTKSLHQYKALDINGKVFDFGQLKGKKVLLVNTASECMLTPQLKKLQELYEEYGGDNFEIIAFPCNDFGNHEPKGNKQIIDYYRSRYNVTFPIMAKVTIKGENPHPVYKWLINKELNGNMDIKVSWNFQKFLIDENGVLIDFISPVKNVKGKRVIRWLNS